MTSLPEVIQLSRRMRRVTFLYSLIWLSLLVLPSVTNGQAGCNKIRSLLQCPTTGCADDPDSPEALFNRAKRRHATGSRPKLLTFADFLKLQNEADERIGPPKVHRELTRADRAKLKNLSVSSGRVEEGSFVKVVGFIATKPALPHATSRESVNCRLSRQVNNDFHISLVQRAGETEFSGIVVEMIPQRRPAGWPVPKLKKIGTRKVLITGALFYDNEHVVNDNPAKPIGGQPKRFSLWEIHPIKEFFVCEDPKNACDPNQIRQWTRLADFEPN